MATRRIDEREAEFSPATADGQWSWAPFGEPPEYMSTTALSIRKGAQAIYRFSGTSISVHGTISLENPRALSSYRIDGGSPVFFEAPATPTKLYHHQFFKSQTLGAGDHTLVITNERDNGFLYLDYFEVTIPNTPNPPPAVDPTPNPNSPTQPNPPPTSPTPTIGGGQGPGAGNSQVTQTFTTMKSADVALPSGASPRSQDPSATSSPGLSGFIPGGSLSSASGSPSSPSDISPIPSASLIVIRQEVASNVAPIVGGILGGFIGLAALLFALFFWRRRRRRGKQLSAESASLSATAFPLEANTTADRHLVNLKASTVDALGFRNEKAGLTEGSSSNDSSITPETPPSPPAPAPPPAPTSVVTSDPEEFLPPPLATPIISPDVTEAPPPAYRRSNV